MRTLKTWVAVGILSVFLTVFLLSGCGSSQQRMMWSGFNEPGQIAYSYRTFDGVERGKVRAEAGEILVFAYAASVDKGEITFQVQAPDETTVWEMTLSESVNDQQVELELSESGTYAILVSGAKTGGDFAASWTLQ